MRWSNLEIEQQQQLFFFSSSLTLSLTPLKLLSEEETKHEPQWAGERFDHKGLIYLALAGGRS